MYNLWGKNRGIIKKKRGTAKYLSECYGDVLPSPTYAYKIVA